MNRIILTCILFLLVSCASENILEKYQCTIIDSYTHVEKNRKKRICIRIPKQLTKEELIEVAEYVRSENTTFRMLFISFVTPDLEPGILGYANVDYNPEFSIRINGLDEKDIKKLKLIKAPEGAKVVGKWYNNSVIREASHMIYLLDGKYYLKSLGKWAPTALLDYLDLEKTTQDGVSKFNFKYSEVNGHLLTNQNGTLSWFEGNKLVVIIKPI